MFPFFTTPFTHQMEGLFRANSLVLNIKGAKQKGLSHWQEKSSRWLWGAPSSELSLADVLHGNRSLTVETGQGLRSTKAAPVRLGIKGSNLEPLGSVAISTSKPLVNKADPEKHWLRKPQKPHETETQACEFLKKKNIPQERIYISTVWRESWFGISTPNQVASSGVISAWVLARPRASPTLTSRLGAQPGSWGRFSLSLLASPQLVEQK